MRERRVRALLIAAACVVLGAAPGLAQTPDSGSSSKAPAPNDPVAQGVAAFKQRDPAAALHHFNDALRADSTNYEANWRSALALVTLGAQTPDSVKSPERDSLYELAVQRARRAVATNPDGAEGQFILANALGRSALSKPTDQKLKLAGEVRAAALRAIELNPSHDGAYHVLGRWNAEIMRLSGVNRFLAKNLMGGQVLSQASWEGATSNLERAVALDPSRITHHLDLAQVYIDRKRWDDARAQLNAVDSLPVRDFLDPQYKQTATALLKKIENKGEKT
ncbi:MAG TPA: tetratricopeptide repeat protein [Gemmatimonadales bacterium]|nr:tetratricopeptide repeat protein [Gemmatimonadales bacterium]